LYNLKADELSHTLRLDASLSFTIITISITRNHIDDVIKFLLIITLSIAIYSMNY